jgi:hypothetical protein
VRIVLLGEAQRRFRTTSCNPATPRAVASRCATALFTPLGLCECLLVLTRGVELFVQRGHHQSITARTVNATNPVKDNLVERVHHWPGINGYRALMTGKRCARRDRVISSVRSVHCRTSSTRSWQLGFAIDYAPWDSPYAIGLFGRAHVMERGIESPFLEMFVTLGLEVNAGF